MWRRGTRTTECELTKKKRTPPTSIKKLVQLVKLLHRQIAECRPPPTQEPPAPSFHLPMLKLVWLWRLQRPPITTKTNYSYYTYRIPSLLVEDDDATLLVHRILPHLVVNVTAFGWLLLRCVLLYTTAPQSRLVYVLAISGLVTKGEHIYKDV